jgi:hypothetical protein
MDTIVQQGCPADSNTGTVTLNCFCELKDTAVEDAAASCKTDQCPKHFQPVFDIQDWRENICQRGSTNDYDQRAYNSYMKMVKGIRDTMLVILPLVALIITGIAGISQEFDFALSLLVFCAILSVLYLAILPPIYTAI